jgi:hypothetical protein
MKPASGVRGSDGDSTPPIEGQGKQEATMEAVLETIKKGTRSWQK